jgi:hypothetical protein
MNDNQAEVRLDLSAETAQGKFSNFALISHTANEFVFDFAFSLPGQPSQVVSRTITSPRHAKAFLQALSENIRRYEASFGEIQEVAVREPGSRTPTN